MKQPKQSHTRGPWKVHPSIKDVVITERGGSICDLVGTKSSAEHEANANLIASAPDLLEALEGIVTKLKRVKCGKDFELHQTLSTCLADAYEALKRARGDE